MTILTIHRTAIVETILISESTRAGVGKVAPAGAMAPTEPIFGAREASENITISFCFKISDLKTGKHTQNC